MLPEKLIRVYRHHKDDFSGVCLITQDANILVSEANGFANRDFNVKNTIDTRFDAASVTKIFTAVAILQLVEQGFLQLNDKIHDVLDLKDTAIPVDVTIEHLLNHTSGIADDADEEAGEDYSALFINKPNYAIRNCADFIPQFAYKAPLFRAGTNVRYNNCAFILLGIAIEQRSGMEYREYVTEHVFKAGGMVNTFFGAKDEVCPNTAEGYTAIRDECGKFIKWKKNIYSYPPIGTADGGALTTVGDLNGLIHALKKGALLSKDYVDILLSPHCGFKRQHRLGTWQTGYGFEFLESNGKIFCIYKEGGNIGVDAICSYYPNLNIGLYMLANQDGPFWTMYSQMQTVIYEVENAY